MLISIPKIGFVNSPGNRDYNCMFIGITLRQWAILISILFFIITAIVTTFTALGTIHTKQILELLEYDIETERERHTDNYGVAISSNEEKLHESQNVIFMSKSILSLYMWISWLNLLLTGLLVYGVCTKTSTYILPWLTTSITSYLLIIISILMMYFDVLNDYYFNYGVVLLVAVACFPIFLIMWTVIFVYQVHLNWQVCQEPPLLPSPPPALVHPPTTVINSNNGYTHTITIPANVNKIQLV